MMCWFVASCDLLGCSLISWGPPALNSGILGSDVKGWILASPGLNSRFWGVLRWSGAQGHSPGVGFASLGPPGLDLDFHGWILARLSIVQWTFCDGF